MRQGHCDEARRPTQRFDNVEMGLLRRMLRLQPTNNLGFRLGQLFALTIEEIICRA